MHARKHYDPSLPLYSIHVPRCAGASMSSVLHCWFGSKLALHYPGYRPDITPARVNEGAGKCIHGHFYHPTLPVALRDYYPSASQCITILRDPLDMISSEYHFARSNGADLPSSLSIYVDAIIEKGEIISYRYLPEMQKAEDAFDAMSEHFIAVGIFEELPRTISYLAGLIGKQIISVPHLNYSSSPERCVLKQRSRFEAAFSHEFQTYHRWKDLLR
jgi:hypothetical protein